MTEITTSPFSIPATDYARETILTHIPAWWWVVAAITIGCGIASLFDLRWAFVGLIVIFLIVPFAIINIYFSRLLNPEARRALAEKQVVFRPGEEIIISYTDPDTPLPEERIGWERIMGITSGKKYARIALSGDSQPFILIAREALTDSQLSELTREILK